MKRNKLALLTLLSVFSIGITACSTHGGDSTNTDSVQYSIYLKAKEAGYEGTYEEWLQTIKGKDGKDGKDGLPGEDGEDGLTPYIGENGHWWIGNTDTGIMAEGKDGNPGKNGVSIVSIQYESTQENVDKYKISYSDGSSSYFTVTNGKDGQSIKGDKGEDGHTPIIIIGENGNWNIDGTDTGIKAQGPQGEVGKNGASVLTGYNEPSTTIGEDGDSYIDLYSWNYYLKENGVWLLKGNIKGADGLDGENGKDGKDGNDGQQGLPGQDGISIVNATVDENGDLIVELSSGDTVNAGHIKDVEEHTVKFYLDDLLVGTQSVKHGEKIRELPQLEDFVVNHWYLDKSFEYEWLWYGCVVTEDMSLYGKYNAIPKYLSFDNTVEMSIDEYGFGHSFDDEKEVCVSKAIETNDYFTVLEDRGILFNKSEIGNIESVSINIDSASFSSSTIYYGNNPMSLDNSKELTSGVNAVLLNGAEYFTIQNTSTEAINIISLDISYSAKTSYYHNELPTVVINTKDSKPVTSRTEYVDCDVTTVGAEKDVSNLKAQIKVRGNSTSGLPKKPYRIKLDKKNSLFGYTKAKNWVLLAEYMDGSNMHNYTALKFAKMVRGEETFGVDPLHVNVILNGENVGLYTFGEHIDGKEGRLNIEQDNIWEKDFDNINFYIERDLSTTTDPEEIEGETYFRVPLENYSVSEYVFAIKYPEKEDFEEKLKDGGVDTHEEEFNVFFNSLKDYMTEICNKFVAYSTDKNEFSNIASSVDVESLALYAVTDQAFRESDHNQKSFKMYRENGGLLKFGPNWDYDSCAYGLPYQGTYVLDPFTSGWNRFENVYFGEKWGYMLYNDLENGRPLCKDIWDEIHIEMVESFIDAQYYEMNNISYSSMYDCGRWMKNQYYSMFDNLQYYWKWVSSEFIYLKNFYSNL